MPSRVQVAHELAGRLGEGRGQAVRQAAAWLVSTGRAHQARYLARDVAGVLADRGYVWVRVTTARALGAQARTQIEAFVRRATGAKELEIEALVDPAVVGGVQIETPLAALDATVRTKLTRYVEGVMN